MVRVKHDGTRPGDVQERCCLCRKPTRFWYTPKDVALCEACATTATPAALPTKEAWIAKEASLMPRPFGYIPQ